MPILHPHEPTPHTPMQCILLILAILVELACNAMGLPLPVTVIAGFYFAVTASWKKNILLLALTFMFLDLCLARPFPISLMQIPILLLMGFLWKSQGNTRDWMPQLVPGLFIGLLFCATAALQLMAGNGRLSLPLMFRILTVSCLATPFLLKLLDHIARQFGYPLLADSSRYYRNTHKKLMQINEPYE